MAFQLFDIFLLLGTSVVLQGDKGTEFAAEVIQELKLLWPPLSLVHGKARYPQIQGSPKGDIKQMLVAWMADNNSWDWTLGIHFVRFSKAPPVNLE